MKANFTLIEKLGLWAIGQMMILYIGFEWIEGWWSVLFIMFAFLLSVGILVKK